jgi:CheY-like chemotaxis protein
MLVADDSRTIQLFFRHAVAKYAHAIELITTEDGHECATLLASGAPDLAFVDVNMPGMSGMEALGAARHKGIRTFVTLMSTNGSAPRLAIARQLNVYEYLVKPFTAHDIEAVIATYRRVSEPMRTLIVDDSRTIRGVIRRLLEQSIFRLAIEEADEGAIAVERCRETPFDLVFLDCNMPGFDGIKTLELLRRRNPETRVIMISAERDHARIAQALALGAAVFLHKPFFVADVDRALHQTLGLRMPGLTNPPGDTPPLAPGGRHWTAKGADAVYLEDVLK